VHDRDPEALTELKYLESLRLKKTGVGDHGLAFLPRISTLKTLDLGGTGVTAKGLARALPTSTES
jgi:hypothetical protein